ncbi:unnamed protein product, partial [Chrysoparadoxa australica]
SSFQGKHKDALSPAFLAPTASPVSVDVDSWIQGYVPSSKKGQFSLFASGLHASDPLMWPQGRLSICRRNWSLFSGSYSSRAHPLRSKLSEGQQQRVVGAAVGQQRRRLEDKAYLGEVTSRDSSSSSHTLAQQGNMRRGVLSTAAAAVVLTSVICVGAVDARPSCDGAVSASVGVSSNSGDGSGSGSGSSSAGPSYAGTGQSSSTGGLQKILASVQASKGHRSYMEDDYFVSSDGRFAAVYDGHGGSKVSKYLRQNMYAEVQAKLHKQVEDCTEDELVEALKAANAKVDHDVQQVGHWKFQGSTSVVVVVHGDSSGNKSIISSNVGDSRAVLSRRGRAVDLTVDHKPNMPSELERVERLGGTVQWFGFFDPENRPIEGTGVYRINANLAVARAIGDRSERPFVSGDCDICVTPMDKEGDHFIIIATDGLWDVMTSDEAVQYVQAVMGGAVGGLREGAKQGASDRKSTDPADVALSEWTQRYQRDRAMIRAAMMSRKKKMSRYLTEEAIRWRGSMDNVTVLVLWMN